MPTRIPLDPIRRLLTPAALLFLALSGCDGDATQLVEELNAAREGCTEEELKASSEECVQMFERYAEMGEDAMETYIGGMRAMDEALQRRGGIQFDTAGLARVFSDSLITSAPDSLLQPGPLELQYLNEERTFEEPQGSWSDGSATWGDESPRSYTDRQPGGQWDARPERGVIRERRPAPLSDPQRPSPSRGRLLPPEDRLRRPWIGDEVPADDYVEEREPRSSRPVARRAPEAAAWPDQPDEQIPPQRRE